MRWPFRQEKKEEIKKSVSTIERIPKKEEEEESIIKKLDEFSFDYITNKTGNIDLIKLCKLNKIKSWYTSDLFNIKEYEVKSEDSPDLIKRRYNLCYICSKFHSEGRDFSLTKDIIDPETGENLGPLKIPLKNCPIAQAVYENCVKFGIISPVWECPEFKRR